MRSVEIPADSESQADPDNYDHIFTPELIAELDAISAEIEAGGKTYSMDEVNEHFIQKRKAWDKAHTPPHHHRKEQP